MEEATVFKRAIKSDGKLPTITVDFYRLIRGYKRAEELGYGNRLLEAKFNNNSSNSSQLLSKDWKKALFKDTDKLDSYKVSALMKCLSAEYYFGLGETGTKGDYQRHPFYELLKTRLPSVERQLAKGYCLSCDQNQVANLPSGITCGMAGPKLIGLMSHVVSKYGLSRAELKEFLADQLQFTLIPSHRKYYALPKPLPMKVYKVIASQLLSEKSTSSVNISTNPSSLFANTNTSISTSTSTPRTSGSLPSTSINPK
jgi:hypothetical protein